MTRVVAVVGPTATGKSDLAIALAHRLDGEIVNADSMQLYAGMDIGTAKLAPEHRGGVRHHLLDVWPVTRTASVADYQGDARATVDRLLAAGRTPILVGGSGLYLRAVLDDLRFPGTDAPARAALEAEAAEHGPARLHARLAELDPATAARIAAQNTRRIVRALEVIELTGVTYSSFLPSYDAVYDVVHIGLDRPGPELDERLATRVERMWDEGFVGEVAALAEAGLRAGVTARRALGYAQVLSHLDGQISVEQARVDTVIATRRFVRRQRSWFRRDPRIRWLDPTGTDPAALAASIEV